MSERRCLFCQYFDIGIPAENLLAEDAAVSRRWGPEVGFGGDCTHPKIPRRYGTNSRGGCGHYEERRPNSKPKEFVREPFID
jgi:hypothetical protein